MKNTAKRITAVLGFWLLAATPCFSQARTKAGDPAELKNIDNAFKLILHSGEKITISPYFNTETESDLAVYTMAPAKRIWFFNNGLKKGSQESWSFTNNSEESMVMLIQGHHKLKYGGSNPWYYSKHKAPHEKLEDEGKAIVGWEDGVGEDSNFTDIVVTINISGPPEE